MPSLLLGLSSNCHQTALLSMLLAHTRWLRLLVFEAPSNFLRGIVAPRLLISGLPHQPIYLLSSYIICVTYSIY